MVAQSDDFRKRVGPRLDEFLFTSMVQSSKVTVSIPCFIVTNNYSVNTELLSKKLCGVRGARTSGKPPERIFQEQLLLFGLCCPALCYLGIDGWVRGVPWTQLRVRKK